jgi:hypothetical protein
VINFYIVADKRIVMKRYLLLGLILLSYLLLASCASNRNPYVKSDYTEERWMREVDRSPNAWARGADSWFLTGDPNATERLNRGAPPAAAISTMMVQVPDFTSIKVLGDFQVQIFGTYGHDSVYVYGPNDGVRDVAVQVRGTTLCIEQIKGASRNVKNVIVRIGMNSVFAITHLGGAATIEGIKLQSNALDIKATPAVTGNMYLAGNVNLRQVNNAGSGTISVFGANASGLSISATGRGGVNASGNINLHSINHRGSNNINIIGANSSSPVKIYAEGSGKIGINGRVNIREIIAKGHTCVYAYPVNSNYIYAYAYDSARIGLGGTTGDLFVDTSGSSRFWGRHLCAQNAYVRAHDRSHVNVSASNKIFASATQRSSVYFFGSPDHMSQFVSGNGVVIPVWSSEYRSCAIVYQPKVYKQVYQGEERVDYKGHYKAHRKPEKQHSREKQHYRWKNGKLVKSAG